MREVRALKRQIELLEERVADLEKQEAEEVEADDSAERVLALCEIDAPFLLSS